MTYKRYEYWGKNGKTWTSWFPWESDIKPEFQMTDRRIISRLFNEYKEDESICTSN